MVPDEGIEPPTFGLQNRCSTAELIRHARGLWARPAGTGYQHWAALAIFLCAKRKGPAGAGPSQCLSLVGLLDFVNVAVLRLRNEEQTDHESAERDDDRIPKTEVNIAGLGHHGEGRGWQKTAEPAVTNVVGQ